MQNLALSNKQSWLSWFLIGAIILGFAILVGRLVELQIIKGDYFHSLAEGNRIRRVPINAPRGLILARGGEVLAGNKEVRKIVEFDPEKGFVKKETTENRDDTISEWQREYPLREQFAHVSGYLGQVSEDEIGKVDPQCQEKGPRTHDMWMGRGGLEEEYNCRLRGIDGEELVEVDTFGKKIRTLGAKKPLIGENIETNIHYELQKKIHEIVQKAEIPPSKAAAFVVTDGRGEVLGFYSSPSYDPNIFLESDDKSRQKISEYFNDNTLPLFNRVIGGTYHPGSVFKLVTTIAALEEGKIKADFIYDDPGVIKINEFSYANWFFTQYGKTEGKIDLTRALARSTDTFYYKLGEFIGVESLASWANKFGFGKSSDIDLPGEISGLVPTPQWKKEAKAENWFLGNTYHMSIGQGDLTATPLEVNLMTSVIANNGYLCKPHFLKTSENNCLKLPIQDSNINLVKQGMIKACQSGGTAFPFFDFEPQVACKTGTAETEEVDKTHAWFTVFAPENNPEIVVTVLVEKGGEGSSVAAPVAREILKYWFHERP